MHEKDTAADINFWYCNADDTRALPSSEIEAKYWMENTSVCLILVSNIKQKNNVCCLKLCERVRSRANDGVILSCKLRAGVKLYSNASFVDFECYILIWKYS